MSSLTLVGSRSAPRTGSRLVVKVLAAWRVGDEWLCLISPMCLRRPWSSAEEVVSLAPNKQSTDLRFAPGSRRSVKRRTGFLVLTSDTRPRDGGCDLWHQHWVPVEYHSLFSKSRAMQASGRCGQGISHSGCLRGACLLADRRPKEPKRTSIPSGTLRKLQEPGA